MLAVPFTDAEHRGFFLSDVTHLGMAFSSSGIAAKLGSCVTLNLDSWQIAFASVI